MSTVPPQLTFALNAAAVKRASRRTKRVVFLIHSPETFSALEPVVQALQARPETFDLLFFALPSRYAADAAAQPSNFGGITATYAFLHGKGLQPAALAGTSLDDLETLVRLCPDFIFRQSPWEPDVPPMFDSSLLAFSHLCYVPYGLMTVAQPRAQYDQPFHNACDFIFCESEFHAESYADHRVRGSQGVHQVGYPRFEQFIAQLAAADGDADAWPLAVGADTPRVIWAPHHSLSKQWLNFSTFLNYADLMLTEARKGRISILFRPHPALRHQLAAHGQMQSSDYDAYLKAFAGAGCSGVDTDREYIRSFAASDCLITDGIGFFSEYMLTGKPLIRTRRSDSTPLNAFGDWLVQACDTVDDAAGLQRTLNDIGTHCYADAFADARAERQQQLSALGSGASDRIVDILEAW